jgi:hypothetical protein
MTFTPANRFYPRWPPKCGAGRGSAKSRIAVQGSDAPLENAKGSRHSIFMVKIICASGGTFAHDPGSLKRRFGSVPEPIWSIESHCGKSHSERNRTNHSGFVRSHCFAWKSKSVNRSEIPFAEFEKVS